MTEVPAIFFVFLATGVVAALGVFALAAMLLRRLGLTMTRRGSEWSLSKEQDAVLGKALWSGNAHLQAQGLLKLVWAIRLSFVVVAASVLGCALTLARAA